MQDLSIRPWTSWMAPEYFMATIDTVSPSTQLCNTDPVVQAVVAQLQASEYISCQGSTIYSLER
jgi:hypothetical protein